MHRISEVEITNFKSIVQATFCFAPYTPVVGYNNAGKSSLLQALNWVVSPHTLQDTDFGDKQQEIRVGVQVAGIDDAVLAGLTEDHRDRITPHLVDGSLRFLRVCAAPKLAPSKFGFKIGGPAGGGDWIDPPNGFAPALKALFPEPIRIRAMEDAAEDVEKNSSSSTIGKLMKDMRRFGRSTTN